MFKTKASGDPFRVIALAVYGVSACFALAAFVGLVGRVISPVLLGDLMLRGREYTLVMTGLDPSSVSSELGYPAWAYATASIWFAPFGVAASAWLYPIICLIIVAITCFFLFKSCSKDISPSFAFLIVVGSMPGFALSEQIKFMNYGIVVMAGLCMFIFSRNFFVRTLGLILALIKPALCVPALVGCWLRKPIAAMHVIVAGFLIIACETLMIILLTNGRIDSVFSIFARYVPTSGPEDRFFVSGDYGVINKLVKMGIVPESFAIIFLSSLLFLIVAAFWYYLKEYEVDLSFTGVIGLGLIPVFTFHRSHDLVVLWPVLALVSSFFLRQLSGSKYFALLVPLFCILYRGSGGGSLYLYLIIILLYAVVYLRSKKAQFQVEQ